MIANIESRLPTTWAEFSWPDWIPLEVRRPIEDFWSEKWGRGPHKWAECAEERCAPPLGTVVERPELSGKSRASGRYVHAWNNIGRVVLEDGTFRYVSIDSSCHSGQRAMSLEEWHAEGVRLFGDDEMLWRFECPVCKHVASPADYKAAGAHSGDVGYNCIGRWTENPMKGLACTKPEPGDSKSPPCDYTAGGLFSFNPIRVQLPDGTSRSVFNFAPLEVTP